MFFSVFQNWRTMHTCTYIVPTTVVPGMRLAQEKLRFFLCNILNDVPHVFPGKYPAELPAVHAYTRLELSAGRSLSGSSAKTLRYAAASI